MVEALTVRLSTAAERATIPWRNGGGSTSEIVRVPVAGESAGSESFDWRVSIATIVEDGAFSVFPGVDRMLMPLSAAGLALDGVRSEPFAQYEVAAFPGEAAVAAVGVAEPGLDLNLMTARATTVGSMRHVAVDEQLLVTAETDTVIVLVSGLLQHAGRMLALHDALVLAPGASAALLGVGSIALLEIGPAS